jgi:hypothetical protein
VLALRTDHTILRCCTHVSALQGVFEHLQSKGIAAPPAVGLQVMVHGTVPLGEQGDSQTQLIEKSAIEQQQ